VDYAHLGHVSVIVPCRDTSRFLGAALDSILSQDPPLLEVIVIDDGSADTSPSVARSYGGVVRCVSQAPAGIAAARNHGVRLAAGALIGFLDADDIWPAGSLAHRIGILADDPDVDCAYGVVETFADPETPGNVTAFLPPPRPARLAGAMLARRSVFDRIGGFDTELSIGETLDWVARLDDHGVVTRATDHVVLRRRVHASNTVRRLADRHNDYIRVMRAALHRRRAAGTP
jgi:glycosyltransferase involved in cell wall biosynthesis